MLKNCLKACSETDLPGLMRFHLPHQRTTLSPVGRATPPAPHTGSSDPLSRRVGR